MPHTSSHASPPAPPRFECVCVSLQLSLRYKKVLWNILSGGANLQYATPHPAATALPLAMSLTPSLPHSPLSAPQSPTTNHQSPTTNHQSPIINHQSLADFASVWMLSLTELKQDRIVSGFVAVDCTRQAVGQLHTVAQGTSQTFKWAPQGRQRQTRLCWRRTHTALLDKPRIAMTGMEGWR